MLLTKRVVHPSSLGPICLAFGLMTILISTTQAELVGLWEFEEGGDLTIATQGADLVLTGTDAAVPGSGTGVDAGAAQLGAGDYYTATHGIAPKGGNSFVNEWTLVMDVSYPEASAGSWMTFYQTNTSNSNDGDAFIRNAGPTGAIGVGATGYSTDVTVADTWYRVVFSVDNSSHHKTYVNGVEWVDGGAQGVDGRFSLDPIMHFFADNDGDDATINVSNIALYDQALNTGQVISLGGAGRAIPSIPEPASAVITLLTMIALAVAHRKRF